MRILADEVDETTYMSPINAGKRLLIMVEVPWMVNQAMEMKLERKREEKTEEMRSQLIEMIIEEQNIPRPIDCLVNSSIMLPTCYLVTMVYYFVYGTADPKKTNKKVSC